jgi:ribosomal protein S18 acetylase RimI-like enzyme
MELTIKKCSPGQVNTLRDVSVKTFYDAFRSFTSEETMGKFLRTAYSMTKLSGEIAESGSSFYFLYQGEEIAGYLKLNVTPSQSDINDEDSLEIERIYIQDRHRGKGYGKHLINFAVETAAKLGKGYIWLGVWEHNENGINFYRRMGFEQFGTHPFIMGDEVQTDYLMRRMV